MKTTDNIHELLMEKGLLTLRSIVNGDYVATSINRRNRNIQVTTRSEGNYLVKQVLDNNSENAVSVLNEIRFYAYLKDNHPRLHHHYPFLRYADQDTITLILDFYTNAIQLWRYYQLRAIENFPFNTVKAIGRVLALVHNEFLLSRISVHKRPDFLKSDMPFIFTTHKPAPEFLSKTATGGLEFVQNIQANPDIMDAIDEMSASWEVNSIIHGDIKLDNFLVMDKENTCPEGSDQVKIIDWELAQYGDYAWDTAGVLQDFIFWWAMSMPDEDSPEKMVQHASFPLEKLKPGIQAFWDSYCEHAENKSVCSETFVLKTVRLSGLRVLQTAYEISSKFEHIPPMAAILLGIGKSIIRKPREAAQHLFGIDQLILEK